MRSPKASFVIPVYNGELYIAEALDSCLLQSEKNIEVVVVDDGSTDSTPEVIEWFVNHDSRVRGFQRANNMGRSNARNIGISQTKADIILMLDADDKASPVRVKETLKHFKKNPGTDIAYGSFQLIDALGNLGPTLEAKDFSVAKLFQDKLTYIGHSTMAFRKKVFEAGLRYTEGEYCKLGIDDWKLQVDALRMGFRFGAISPILSYYRYKEKPRDEKRVNELKDLELANQEGLLRVV